MRPLPPGAAQAAATNPLARRVIWGLGAMVALTVIGVIGFMAVAGASLLDALFMTIVTISTVLPVGQVRASTPSGPWWR